MFFINSYKIQNLDLYISLHFPVFWSIAITESTLFPSGTGIGAVYSVDAALGSDESQGIVYLADFQVL